jgi:Flp pilus assembly protein TadD
MSALERYERSRALFKRGDFAGALAAVREAIALAPGMSEAHNFVGWILLKMPSRTPGDLESAIASFREARRLAPSDAVPFTNLCDALVVADRAREAAALAESVLHEHPLDAVAYNWLGWYYREAGGDLVRAIAHLKQSTRLRDRWGVAWLNLAIALDRSGAQADAWRAYATAMSCGDAHDPKLAKRRHREIEKEMRGRGEEPPKEPWRGIDGQPLGPEYEAIALMFEEKRFDDAILAIEKLAKGDSMARFYTSGYTASAAATAYQSGHRKQARRLADLAVQGAREWASGASSGAEGMGRTYDLEQLIKRLARYR